MNTYSEDKMYENYSSEVERMQKCIDELQQENQELKRQLEEYKEQVSKGLYNICLPYKTGYDKAIK